MAASGDKLYCEFCQLGFNFASKYHAHLRSSGHRALEDILTKDLSSDIQAEYLTPVNSEEFKCAR